MKSLVSIIVPVYNVEEYLDRCLESIVKQTYPNWEAILVDDGSPDSCPEKCDDWAGKDQRIKVIHKHNGGVSSARNAGLDVAGGEYVTFVDPDDFLTPHAIEVMHKRLQEDQSDMVVAQKVKVYPNGEKEDTTDTWMKEMILGKEEAMHMVGSTETPFPATLCAKLYRKFIFKDFRFTNLKSGEDTCAVPYIIDQCTLISVTNTVTYYYFQRATSVIHTGSRDQQLDSIKAVVKVARFLLDRGYLKEAKVFFLSAVCKYIDLKYDREAKRIITGTFSRKERKILKSRDRKTMILVLAHSFPRTYKLYKSVKKQ